MLTWFPSWLDFGKLEKKPPKPKYVFELKYFLAQNSRVSSICKIG